MIRHHPDSNVLMEYAAGTLPWAMSLAVGAHLQLCPRCREGRHQLDCVGGGLLRHTEPQAVHSDSLARVLQRIDQDENNPSQSDQVGPEANTAHSAGVGSGNRDRSLDQLPRLVDKLVRDNQPLHWRRMSSSLQMARLASGQNQCEVALQRIRQGGKVVEHDHRGREITLVLYGSFSDADGVYAPGDFLVREPGEVHRPMATQDQECLCLSVAEAAVSVTGILGWLVNPLLRFRPA
ncbi:ChrR family anti-sigma-E factor [Microbulbifer discodermiae]|uniref:ChrR family anti-sigma-E factor n=1 Tax=Microbulbifer sp. 2201CG32-9 TaxID=3232309 RepID=UPI00345BFC4C